MTKDGATKKTITTKNGSISNNRCTFCTLCIFFTIISNIHIDSKFPDNIRKQ